MDQRIEKPVDSSYNLWCVQKLRWLELMVRAAPESWPLLKADLSLYNADCIHKAGVTGAHHTLTWRLLCQLFGVSARSCMPEQTLAGTPPVS